MCNLIIRYTVACMAYREFVKRSKVLIGNFIKQSYDRDLLKKTFMKFTTQYRDNLKINLQYRS